MFHANAWDFFNTLFDHIYNNLVSAFRLLISMGTIRRRKNNLDAKLLSKCHYLVACENNTLDNHYSVWYPKFIYYLVMDELDDVILSNKDH